MRKICLQISVIVSLLLSSIDAVCQQTDTNINVIEMVDFSDRFLLNGKTGKIFFVGANDSLHNVIVRWGNGYFAIGTTFEGNAIGKWFLYDKGNRLREYLILGGSCVLYSKKMNKKGEMVSEFKAITPCF